MDVSTYFCLKTPQIAFIKKLKNCMDVTSVPGPSSGPAMPIPQFPLAPQPSIIRAQQKVPSSISLLTGPYRHHIKLINDL